MNQAVEQPQEKENHRARALSNPPLDSTMLWLGLCSKVESKPNASATMWKNCPATSKEQPNVGIGRTQEKKKKRLLLASNTTLQPPKPKQKQQQRKRYYYTTNSCRSSCSSLFEADRFSCCYINKSEDSLESSEPNKSPLGDLGNFTLPAFFPFTVLLGRYVSSVSIGFGFSVSYFLAFLLCCYVSCSAKNEEAPACCSRFYSSSRE